ncbi:MAG: general secretion pathway protein GspK [Rhodospirillales bacterium]|nr:general secretion pathway protein GspK [Rhodospirillales bacterium]
MTRKWLAQADRQRGIALLMVLGALMILSFLAIVYASNVRTEVLLSRNLVDNAEAEALADGAIYKAAARLAIDPRDGGLYGDGRIYVWHSDNAEIRLTIRDEGGKVDLNQAPAILLRELFIAIGEEPGHSDELADEIVDFRDEDDDKSPHGAEAPEYRKAGLAWGPKNRSFEMVEELAYVVGVTPDLYRRIAPLVSVYGQQENPHIPTAPLEVRTAVAAVAVDSHGRNANATGSELSQRSSQLPNRSGLSFGGSRFGRRGDLGGEPLDAADSSADDDSAANANSEDRSGVPVFTVHAESRTNSGTVFVREAIVDFSASTDQPFAIQAWRQGVRVMF